MHTDYSSLAKLSPDELFTQFSTSTKGLTMAQARQRYQRNGPNKLSIESEPSLFSRLIKTVKDPLSLLLITLGVVSFITGDFKATLLIAVMLLISITLRFTQELNASQAAQKLNKLVTTTATVVRGGVNHELPLSHLVVGDVITLTAGDLIPADVQLIFSKDLFVNQSLLSGESLPVEKDTATTGSVDNPFQLKNICLLGTHIESGVAQAVVIATGPQTYLGSLAQDLNALTEVSNFDRGIKSTTWLFIRFMAVMVPVVFLLNGLVRGDWLEAFLFALAVAVGLTPELLPAIVTINLSKGAINMSHKKVIVKRLNAIQNFGAIDVLCTDKTGTLTEGKVSLIKHLDISGADAPRVLDLAVINSFFQTGLKNLMDTAIVSHNPGNSTKIKTQYQKVDEIPYDFSRRRMSVVVANDQGQHQLVTKGAVSEMLSVITHVEQGNGSRQPLTPQLKRKAIDMAESLNQDGYRVLLIAYRKITDSQKTYGVADETDLVLSGFLAFLDPPKSTARDTISQLAQYGVSIKILTGDNELVTQSTCRQVGLPTNKFVLGERIEHCSAGELADLVTVNTMFCRLLPHHKQRIIEALQQRQHVVGFLGDGINDAPALKAADVGISVNTAVDVAKESSDIILLEKSLKVLGDGVIEGRKIFGNIIKYLRMTASSNFGNMFSILGASLFLPFLPMLPLQIMTNNLLYDISQTSIPTDNVDPEFIMKPRRWRISNLQRFILFVGPISSVFDYATYFLMLFVFNAWVNPPLFRTGWFVESLVTQTLIIHVLRTDKIPFLQSRASLPLTLTTLAVVALGLYLPFSNFAPVFGFVPLPPLYFVFLAVFMVAYVLLTQSVKKLLIRRFHLE